jgi:hypothetical protein
VFLDIFPILRNPVAFETLITHFLHHLTSHTIPKAPEKRIDVVVGLDARGFLLGPIIALRLGAAFVPVRKAGKLPGECVSASYAKEYGTVSPTIVTAMSQGTIMFFKGYVRNAEGLHKTGTDGGRGRRSDCDRLIIEIYLIRIAPDDKFQVVRPKLLANSFQSKVEIYSNTFS